MISISTTYDNDFRPMTFTYAGGTTSLGYDPDGLLVQAGPFTITRNPQNGLPTSMTDGTLTRSIGYNPFGEVVDTDTSVASQPAFRMELTRNQTARIEVKRETLAAITIEYVYSYDLLDRLLTVTRNGTQVESYAYDGNGRRFQTISLLRGVSARPSTYNTDDQRTKPRMRGESRR